MGFACWECYGNLIGQSLGLDNNYFNERKHDEGGWKGCEANLGESAG